LRAWPSGMVLPWFYINSAIFSFIIYIFKIYPILGLSSGFF